MYKYNRKYTIKSDNECKLVAEENIVVGAVEIVVDASELNAFQVEK